MNKKIKKRIAVLIFAIILLFAMPMVDSINAGALDLVSDASGGSVIKIKLIEPSYYPRYNIIANIHNIGDADATRVNWSIKLHGGFILLGATKTGRMEVIPPGENVNIHSDHFIFGIGRTILTISAECAEGSSDELNFHAFIFGLVIFIYSEAQR